MRGGVPARVFACESEQVVKVIFSDQSVLGDGVEGVLKVLPDSFAVCSTESNVQRIKRLLVEVVLENHGCLSRRNAGCLP